MLDRIIYKSTFATKEALHHVEVSRTGRSNFLVSDSYFNQSNSFECIYKTLKHINVVESTLRNKGLVLIKQRNIKSSALVDLRIALFRAETNFFKAISQKIKQFLLTFKYDVKLLADPSLTLHFSRHEYKAKSGDVSRSVTYRLSELNGMFVVSEFVNDKKLKQEHILSHGCDYEEQKKVYDNYATNFSLDLPAFNTLGSPTVKSVRDVRAPLLSRVVKADEVSVLETPGTGDTKLVDSYTLGRGDKDEIKKMDISQSVERAMENCFEKSNINDWEEHETLCKFIRKRQKVPTGIYSITLKEEQATFLVVGYDKEQFAFIQSNVGGVWTEGYYDSYSVQEEPYKHGLIIKQLRWALKASFIPEEAITELGDEQSQDEPVSNQVAEMPVTEQCEPIDDNIPSEAPFSATDESFSDYPDYPSEDEMAYLDDNAPMVDTMPEFTAEPLDAPVQLDVQERVTHFEQVNVGRDGGFAEDVPQEMLEYQTKRRSV